MKRQTLIPWAIVGVMLGIELWRCAPRPSVQWYTGLEAQRYFEVLNEGWHLTPPLEWSGQFQARWGPWGAMNGTFDLVVKADSVWVYLHGPWGDQTLVWPRLDTPQTSGIPTMALITWLDLATSSPKVIRIHTLEIHGHRYKFTGRKEGTAIQFELDGKGRPLWIQTEGERLEILAYNGEQPIAIHYEMGGGTLDLKIQSSENGKHQ